MYLSSLKNQHAGCRRVQRTVNCEEDMQALHARVGWGGASESASTAVSHRPEFPRLVAPRGGLRAILTDCRSVDRETKTKFLAVNETEEKKKKNSAVMRSDFCFFETHLCKLPVIYTYILPASKMTLIPRNGKMGR